MNIRGCDISSLLTRKAAANFEHRSGVKGTSLDLVGRVLTAKKILTEADCANDRERYYWKCVKMPLIYGVIRLFDDTGHPGAVSLASTVRDSLQHGDPLMLQYSIEGSTVDKQGPDLKSTVARGVAITIRPANRTCLSGVLDAGTPTPAQFDKSELALLSRGPELALYDPLGLEDLAKAIDAGSAEGPPGTAVQGSALQKAQPHRPTSQTPSEPGYAYHATNEERAHDIAHQGLLTHLPHEFTDQDAWPDGATERRNYHSANAGAVHSFAPEEGRPVILRTRLDAHPFKRESTGDLYSRKPVPPHLMEIGMDDGTWQPIRRWAGLDKAEAPPAPLVVQGRPLTPRPHLQHAVLDEARGVLHTPRGTLALDPGTGLSLDHPAVHHVHDRAAQGWARAHRLLRDGQVPEEVALHAAEVAGLPGVAPLLKAYADAHGHDGRALVGALVKHAAPDHPEPVPGLTPAAARRMALLVGAGSVLPHDPDVLNHVLGLHKDEEAGAYARGILNDPNQPHLAEGLDRWYAAHHHATRQVLEKHGGQGMLDAVEHGVGLGGLLHALALHRQGHPLGAEHPLAKGELTGIHQAYERHGGQGRADLLYLAFLLPRLLDQAQARQGSVHEQLAGTAPRLERAALQLREMMPDILNAPPDALWPGGPQIRTVDLHGVDDQPLRAGRVMILNGQVHHLEDYHGALGRLLPQGPLDDAAVARLHALEASPHLALAMDHDYMPATEQEPAQAPAEAPSHDEAVPNAQGAPAGGPPATEAYRYRRAGAEREALLEVCGDYAYLDGGPVPGHLVDLMLANVAAGTATLVPAGALGKTEVIDLTKADPEHDPGDALQYFRDRMGSDPEAKAHLDALTQHIFVDPKTAEHNLGNAYAWQKFQEQPRPGIYVGIDGNHLKTINDTYGHAAGNQAISTMAGAMRGGHDEATPGAGKLFRTGGDEFMAHFPSYEHAVRWMHAANKHLESAPPIAGKHKVSMSFGLGHNAEQADQALYEAKKQKLTPTGAAAYAPHQVPNLAHSLVSGKEGPIRLHHEAPPHVPVAPSAPKPHATVPGISAAA